jgi:uncharacterized membrane protein
MQMDEMACLLIPLAIVILLSGPIALIVSIVALNKIREIRYRLEGNVVLPPRPSETTIASQPPPEPVKEQLTPEPVFKPVIVPKVETAAAAKPVILPEAHTAGSLEQKIGTSWILIAGIVTSIVGVGFFLKYAYDNDLIGPLGRVAIAAVGGLVALFVGEVTRRRGYGLAAKGVTSLGFATLYAAVFSAYRFYGLIGSAPAFVLAILITASAMLYAVALDEIIIAFFSLLGGFLTPVLVSTGENRPMALFGYVLVLGTGAILCSYYRKWRAVTVLSFVGTYLLYTGWFEKFYRPEILKSQTPEQIAIALGWLAVFFIVYLILPVLYGLVRKSAARREDVMLVLANAVVTFYYLWTILFDKFRTELAFCAVGLCLAHLALMTVATKRCKDDIALRLSLLVIGLFFLTIAIPLYLKMYAVAIAWSAEAIVLTIVGLRYRSVWTQAGGAIALLLSFAQLMLNLPMHKGAFAVVLNPAFGSWCFVAATVVACHLIYRNKSELIKDTQGVVSQFLYAVAGLLLFAAIAQEWYWHLRYNIAAATAFPQELFITGMLPLFAVFTLLFVIRPICPQGMLLKGAATILAIASALFTMISFPEIYRRSFAIFANTEFAIAVLLIAALFASALLLKHRQDEDENTLVFAIVFALLGIVALWVLISEEIYLYWSCRNRYLQPTPNWQLLANMYTSIAWAAYGIALMVVGFWRKIKTLRYAALGLFGVLLVKVFVMDMSTVKNVYRIAAFLATGVTLVAVSYLYQYLKKRGFFDTLSSQNITNTQSGDSK